MSTGRQRLSGRDYKNAGRSRPVFDVAQYRQFGAGLAVGLVVALFVWIHHHRALPPADDPGAVAGPDVAIDDPITASATGEPDGAPADFAFYDMLPNFEVEVPERKQPRKPVQPVQPVAIPGAYVLQVGAYRNVAGAELLRDKLAKLEIEASILHVSDDTDVWHVVRVGPIRDLDRLNAMQKTLHAAGIDVLVQRAGD